MSDFRDLVDLASSRLGGIAVAANDEFFAPRENLLRPEPPIFREGEYTDRGKWMDGWETRRRRDDGHDWCVVRLGLPGRVRGVVIDTAHFVGNFPQAASLEVAEFDGSLDRDAIASTSLSWKEVLPRSALGGNQQNHFAVASDNRSTHVRLNIYPDGGVARLRVHGEVLPDWAQIRGRGGDIDLAGIENGGVAVAASDMFFGSCQNLILPGASRGMDDGWETRRRRGPGHDWAIIRLGTAGTIRRAEVDTRHFKGNAPGACSIEVALAARVEGGKEEALLSAAGWKELLARTRLQPDTLHRFERELAAAGPATHARLNIFPDGGVSRLRLFGSPSGAGA
jgi:allantoicase